MRRIMALVALGALTSALAACSGDTAAPTSAEDASVREVTVAMQDVSFAPDVIAVRLGEVVRLNFENRGALVHDFTIDSMPMGRMQMTGGTTGNGHGGHGPEAAMHMALTTGEIGMIEFEATEPGDYVYYCNEPGHREAGMHGILRVS